MPQNKRQQLVKAAWAWIDSVEPDQITQDHVQAAYRVSSARCKVGSCRRNCRWNPHCLSGLGESRWLSSTQDDDDEEDLELQLRQPNTFVGLKNLGATCYVNSLLQLWFHNLSFRRALFSWNPQEDPIESIDFPLEEISFVNPPKSVVGHLQLLFALMQFGKQKSVDPSDFIKALGLEPSIQQDAQEFSKLFISLLEEALSHQSDSTVRNLINNNFKGEYCYVTKCSKCEKESVSPSMFYELQLNVKGNKTLDESIAEFLKEEKMEGANSYCCGTCQKEQEASRFIRLQSLPPILNLQLMRFIYDRQKGHKKKLNSSIQFPDSLNMSQYIWGESNGRKDLMYNLSAVLIHKGPSAYSGHYVAHICDQTTGTWYKFNDESAEKMEGKKLKLAAEDAEEVGKKVKQPRLPKGFLASNNAYMLVYTAATVEEGKNPITLSNISSYLQRQVDLYNNTFADLIANVKEDKEFKKANGKIHRAEMASLLTSLPVPVEDQKWEAISVKWLSQWLSNKASSEPVDNSKLLCPHGQLDPNIVTEAKFINLNAADVIYHKFGGGPRLIMEDAECRECIVLKCKEIRTKTKIAEDAKEVGNLLKKKDSPDSPGFWVGKRSLKTWKKKAISRLLEETQHKNSLLDMRDQQSPTSSSNMNQNQSPTSTTMDIDDDKPMEHLHNGNHDDSPDGKGAEADSMVESTVTEINSVVESNEMSESRKRSLDENDVSSSSPVAETFQMKKVKLDDDEKDDSGDDCRNTKSEDEDDIVEDFNEDIVCPHRNLTHEEQHRRIVNAETWSIFSKYFPESRVFPRDSEPCQECLNIACEDQVAKDMYKKQAHSQRELLQSLFNGKNRPVPGTGVYRVINVPNFLEPWKKFIRNAGRKEPPISLRNSSLVCLHGNLLYNPEIDEDFSRLHCVTDKEWEVLSSVYVVDQEVKMSWGPNNEVIMEPPVCFECVEERLENEQKALLHYTKGKLYIRQVATNKVVEDNEGPPSTQSGADGFNAKRIRTDSGEVRRSTRHRKMRGEKEVLISSDQTLKDLKLQILNTFGVAPYDQHLSTEDGRELTDNLATLASLNIFPNSVIFLKVDEPPDEDSSTPVDDFIRTSEPEAGFTGTALLKR